MDINKQYINEEEPSGLSVISMVFGIIAFVCFGFAFPFAIIGLIMAIIVIVKHKGGKGFAIAGIITSLISLIITFLIAASVVVMIPYKDDVVDLYSNASQYVQEYKETKDFPPLFDSLIEDGKIYKERAAEFMDFFSEFF